MPCATPARDARNDSTAGRCVLHEPAASPSWVAQGVVVDAGPAAGKSPKAFLLWVYFVRVYHVCWLLIDTTEEHAAKRRHYARVTFCYFVTIKYRILSIGRAAELLHVE